MIALQALENLITALRNNAVHVLLAFAGLAIACLILWLWAKASDG